VELDWRCDIFHNLLFKNFITRKPDLKDLEVRNGRMFNVATGTQPCILHASGNALMEGIAARLGYEPACARPTENNKNYFRKALFHAIQLASLRRSRRRISPSPATLPPDQFVGARSSQPPDLP
jgi:hypothetical protein